MDPDDSSRGSLRSGIETVLPVVTLSVPTNPDPPNPVANSHTGFSSSTLRPVRPTQLRQSSVRIRRLPSASAAPPANARTISHGGVDDGERRSRRRSASAPQRPQIPQADVEREHALESQLPCVFEENQQHQPETSLQPPPQTGGPSGRLRSASSAARSIRSQLSAGSVEVSRWVTARDPRGETDDAEHNYESDVVDLLDVVDPEVSTLSTLTNVQNSLFIPDLGGLLNRRPTYNLTRRPTRISEKDSHSEESAGALTRPSTILVPAQSTRPTGKPEHLGDELQADTSGRRRRSHSLSSELSDSHYAVLPHGVTLEGWSEEDKEELNDHVRHLLHSRKAKFRRKMRGFGKYIQRPLGFFVTLYAVLITLFGLAWVLFLIGWINVGGRQDYLINVIDNVLVALFAVMGDGLAPFRAVDTYHMCFIAHYHHLTWRLRREKALPKLGNENDLPAKVVSEAERDLETAAEEKEEFSMLTPEQQKRLVHHQTKFAKSHTFYRPHETVTHHAFPLRLLVAVVCLLDCHSLFQIALGTCTWAISYHTRPNALTPTILCFSISCNISAGIVIAVGDRKTRKKDVIERIFRQALTQEAMKKLEAERALSHEENQEKDAESRTLERSKSVKKVADSAKAH